MKINAFKTDEKYPKLTTYHITINNNSILLDYGVNLNNKDFIGSLDLIFITHEHGDHIAGLVNEFKFLKEDCVVFMTKTCKDILKAKYDDEFKKFLDYHTCVLCFNDSLNVEGIDITFYQAGHTFGSACVLLKGDYSIFYTGDINYASFDNLCSYDIPYSLDVDYLLLDGTSLSKNTDFKKLSLSHLKKDIPKFKKYYINAKAEKAVFIAKYLCDTYDNIYYEPDLRDYLSILIKAGYEPFKQYKISYDINSNYKNELGIYISSTMFSEFNKDFVLSLHISNDDIKELMFRFNSIGKVLIGHCYGIDELDGFTILKEGSNDV